MDWKIIHERSEALKMLIPKLPEFSSKLSILYQVLGWTWGKKGIPTANEIQTTLCELIMTLSGDVSVGYTETGGLFAAIEKNEEGQWTASMGFNLKEIGYVGMD